MEELSSMLLVPSAAEVGDPAALEPTCVQGLIYGEKAVEGKP